MGQIGLLGPEEAFFNRGQDIYTSVSHSFVFRNTMELQACVGHSCEHAAATATSSIAASASSRSRGGVLTTTRTPVQGETHAQCRPMHQGNPMHALHLGQVGSGGRHGHPGRAGEYTARARQIYNKKCVVNKWLREGREGGARRPTRAQSARQVGSSSVDRARCGPLVLGTWCRSWSWALTACRVRVHVAARIRFKMAAGQRQI